MTTDAGLPGPDSDELKALIGTIEVREAYRFLHQRRSDPPTMDEWRIRAAQVFGKANEQTDRRLRQVREYFLVECKKINGKYVYILGARKPKPAAAPISARLESEVYTLKGRYCRMCGKGPEDGIKLQIDHKIPAAWRGKTELDNLEPLCERHNHGKQAFLSTYDEDGPIIRDAMMLPDVWQRIGELLKAMGDKGKQTPSELVGLVAGQYFGGDPARRLRDRRTPLGWIINGRKRKHDGKTLTFYQLEQSQPWPEGGLAEW